MKLMRSFETPFKFVVQHGNNIVCDKYVFDTQNYREIQVLDHDTTGALALSDRTLLCGHKFYAEISAWKWTGEKYEKVQKRASMGRYASCTGFDNTAITKLSRDKFSQLPNAIFVIAGDRTLYRLLLNAKDL